jgi:hypothetical protein
MSNARKTRPKAAEPRPGRSYSSAATEDDAVSTEGLDFWLDDVRFVCHGRLSAFDLAEFAGRAEDAGPEIADPGVVRILGDFMHTILGDPTYADVTRHRRAHKTPDAVVQQILFDLIEATVSRPTARPSPSPAGPPGPVSPPAVSPSPGTPALSVPARQAAVLRVLAAQGDVTLAGPPAEPEPRAPVVRRVSVRHPGRPVTVEELPETETG